MNVLFVDPDEGVAESVGAVLRRKGHSCEIVGRGEKALALVQQGGYDIVVLEIDLPDMNGFRVIHRLKENRVATPVLLQSGQAGMSLAAKAGELRNYEIFAKPYIATELIARMEQLVARAEDPGPAHHDTMDGQAHRAEINGTGSATIKAENNDDRREDPRNPFIEAALITGASGPIPCVVLNLSRGGAAIKLPDEDRDCPSRFTLELLDGPSQRCEMRWRRGDRIGVAFV